MDRFVLGMTHEQIQQGEQLAKEWSPHATSREELLETFYVNGLVLKGFAGPPARQMAIINGVPVEAGGQAKVNVRHTLLTVRCLEIKEQSAVITVDGISRRHEITLQR